MSDNNNLNHAYSGIGLGLLRFCLQHTDGNVVETDLSNFNREPEDYVWLKEALNNLESDTLKMKKLLEKLSESDTTTQQMVFALEGIQYFIEDLDLANDLVKLDLQRLVDFLTHENVDVRRWSAWIFASAAQNNPKTQLTLITKYNLLSLLTCAIVVETDDHTKDKQLYALSSLTSGSLTLMNEFVDTHNGLTILASLLKHTSLPTTHFKATWFLKKLLLGRPSNKSILRINDILPDLLKLFGDSTKTQTIHVVCEVLMLLVKGDVEVSYQCKCLGLDKILIGLLKSDQIDDELKSICKDLLTLILTQK